MFPSIRIEGAILSADILDKIEREDLPGQRPADFGLAPAAKVKDEIAAAWADAKAQWSIFRRRTPSSFIIHNSSFTSETRNLWLVPLLGILGYRPELARSGEVVNGKNYPVSHRLPDRDALPLHLIGFNDSLDTKVRRSADPTSSFIPHNSSFKTSPHGLLQEYLNVTEHLYGLVANGRVLRLLRNSSRLIRLSFLEFDLERMMEEDLFADFALLYRLLHATRLPRTRAEAPASWIEHYHQDSLEQGSRIRDGLSQAVEEVILTLGNGFLKENQRNLRINNQEGRRGETASGEWRMASGDESANDHSPSSFIIHNSSFFLSLLRLVYRLLFLFVIEERDLVFPPDADRRKRDIYYRHYSLQRLRRLAEKRGLAEDTHDDLWTALLATFRLFEPGDHGAPLGISPLAGDLFSPSAIEPLHTLRLPNTLLRDCLRKLGLFTHPRTGQRMRVNYAALNVEEFGSVYEGLLEYEPVITTEGDRPTFTLVKGDDRANTGSHYTPDDLVQPLIKHSLDYLIAEKLEEARRMANGEWRTEEEKHYAYQLISRAGCLEPGGRSRGADLRNHPRPAAGGTLRPDEPNAPGSGLDSVQHGGGMGASLSGGVHQFPPQGERQPHGVGDPAHHRPTGEAPRRDEGGRELGGAGDSREATAQPGAEPAEAKGNRRIASGSHDPSPLTANSEQRVANREGNPHHSPFTTHHSPPTANSEQRAANRGGESHHSPLATPHSPESTFAFTPFATRYSLFATQGLLALRVADIACGSGHILLAAARRIGLALATVRTGEEQPAPAALRMAVRDVIRHCIYGVDLNPLAVELCKVALWLEAHVPGQPLNFLDHHIKCGNAIVGFVRREELDKGVPDEAFKTLPGDDKDLAAEFRKRNKAERKEHATGQRKLAPALQKQLDDILLRWGDLSALPEHTPAQIAEKKRRFDEFSSGRGAWLLEQIAAIPIAQFYTPKTHEHKNHLLTDEPYRAFLSGQRHPQGEATAHAWATAHRKRFFHWFLQFPDILEQGGFDCILGNPPYLGGQALSGTYGYPFCEYVRWQYAPTGLSELVAFFLRRIHTLLRPGGFTAFITTNSIKDGDVRKDGLEQVVAQGATINMAVRGIKWPGRANLVVSLVTIHAGPWKGPYVLDNRTVDTINPFFEDAENLGEPDKLPENDSRVFQGSIFLGDGFLLTHEAAERLRRNDPRNAEVLFPLINGQELNNQPDQVPGRTIINFFDWPEERAREFPEPFAIVEEKVKPVREDNNREVYRKRWWNYAEPRPKLFRNIAPFDRCFVAAATTKHLNFSAAPTNRVFANTIYVFTTDRWDHFAVVQSTLHEVWARKYSGALKQDLRYSPSKCFDTFPFPAGLLANGEQRMARGGRQPSSERRTASGESVSNHSPLATHHSLKTIGFAYHEHRRDLMLRLWLGLTDIYNLFHAPDLEQRLEALFKKRMGNGDWRVAAKVPPEHMDTAGSLTLADAIADIKRLRQLHVELDHTVLAAYGWAGEANSEQRVANGESASNHSPFTTHQSPPTANSEQRVANRGGESHHSPFNTHHSPTTANSEQRVANRGGKSNHSPLTTHHSQEIVLGHDFHEIETLPENDRTRYTISPEARKELLQRLLKLNHERAAEEAGATTVVKAAKKKARKAATKDTESEAAKGGANVYFRRTVLAAEIIDRLHRENTFGHVKFEKVIFLTERMLNLDFQSNYHRDAAGPYDNRALRSIDSQIKKLQWYAPVKSDKRYEYRPLAKAGAHKPYFDNWYGGKEDRFSEIIELLRPLTTQRCEIVATLYSAWEDFLSANKDPSDEEIVAEVQTNWHPSKEAIEPDRWQKALEWMRKEGLTPTKTTASTHEK